MRTILKAILLMSLCSSATVPAMAINRANHDKKDANIHTSPLHGFSAGKQIIFVKISES